MEAGGGGGGQEQPLAAEEMSRLGFSDVVNQEHRRVRAFKEEPERNREELCDRFLALRRRTGVPAPCVLTSSETLNSGTSWPRMHILVR